MNYAIIRDKLVADLESIPGIGKVFKYPRVAKDWGTFLNLYKVTNPHDGTKGVISVAWITRIKGVGLDVGIGTDDESSVPVTVDRTDTWEIMVVYGHSDDEANPSEYDFQALVDNIIAKWELMSSLGLPDQVNNSWPAQLEDAGLYVFGEMLCHRARITIRLNQFVNS